LQFLTTGKDWSAGLCKFPKENYQRQSFKLMSIKPTLNLRSCCASVVLAIFAIVTSHAGERTELKDKNPKAHVVFLISEDPDNYQATSTIPIFADSLTRKYGFKVTVLLGEGERTSFIFPGLEVISEADLVVVFCRRVALPHSQLALIKNYLKQGKPLVGIRTAHHAFSAVGQIANGHQAWPEFPADILGCENRGYGPTELGTDVSVVSEVKNHSILRSLTQPQWHSKGNTYHVAPLLDSNAVVLLTGSVKGKVEPIAWIRQTPDRNRVFYTSLGYPADFLDPQFTNLLSNGIHWALNLKVRRQ
jgi:type 1 glutamine amidotransferase